MNGFWKAVALPREADQFTLVNRLDTPGAGGSTTAFRRFPRQVSNCCPSHSFLAGRE